MKLIESNTPVQEKDVIRDPETLPAQGGNVSRYGNGNILGFREYRFILTQFHERPVRLRLAISLFGTHRDRRK